MVELSFGFKEDTGYDAAWVGFKTATVDEASDLIQEMKAKGVFEGVKALADFFRQLKHIVPPDQEQAESTVQKVLPGSEVKSRYPNHGYGTGIQGEQTLPDSVTPHCLGCGRAAVHKEGTSKQGTPYNGWFCLNKDCGKYWKPVK